MSNENLYIDLYGDNNAGIILVIHDKQGNAKYIHTYDGYRTNMDKGYSWDGNDEYGPFWNEQDSCSLGDDLKYFAEDPENCANGDGNELWTWANDGIEPYDYDPKLKDDNTLTQDVCDYAQYVYAQDMTPEEAGRIGEALKKSGAC